jgi:hypothetical protein
VKAMYWKWHPMSALAERSGRDEVKPSLTQTAMKTDARALKQGAPLLEPPDADPHVRCVAGESGLPLPYTDDNALTGARS